jgi:hypothetical protein
MAQFTYNWTSGTVTQITMPSLRGGCSSADEQHSAQTSASSKLIAEDDSNKYDMQDPAEAINYLEDYAMYLVAATSKAQAYYNQAVTNTKFWDEKEKDCAQWQSAIHWSCWKHSRFCYWSETTLEGIYGDWVVVKSLWTTTLAELNKLLVTVNSEIEVIQQQSLNQAIINETIANTNLTIAYAKGTETEVEEEIRVSKFFTLILPVVILLIAIVFLFRK